ncbi:hypothetical protein J6590_100810 [Homalodisca vitripennis]|nr:hypothetical protein J6590_100810 [Homalodisca vitripennis]
MHSNQDSLVRDPTVPSLTMTVLLYGEAYTTHVTRTSEGGRLVRMNQVMSLHGTKEDTQHMSHAQVKEEDW